MQTVDLIIENAAQLVTCASGGKPKRFLEMQNVGVVERGALAIDAGKIIGVGKTEEIYKQFKSENVIDAKNKVVCPAFVDPHTHVVFAGNRLDEFELKIKGVNYLEILESGGGIISTVEQTRKASLAELVDVVLAAQFFGDAFKGCGQSAGRRLRAKNLAACRSRQIFEIFSAERIIAATRPARIHSPAAARKRKR